MLHINFKMEQTPLLYGKKAAGNANFNSQDANAQAIDPWILGCNDLFNLCSQYSFIAIL